MFKTLLLKEIHESVINFRFWLVTVLCLLLIPFGLYIASKDYQSRLKEIQNEQNQYLDKVQGKVNEGIQAEGYFIPSPLSILSLGFRDYLPYKAVTSRDGFAKTERKQQDSNIQSVMFGKIDFVFIVTNFLSLLALIFTFGCISSEAESGTLKLQVANQVPRWKIILAKIFGNYIVFLAPFLISVIIGLIVIQIVAGVNFLSAQYAGTLVFVLLFSMVFLLMYFNLGIWASVISRNTITSIIILLFIWIVITLGIPRISPMVAQIISPVPTEEVFRKEVQSLKSQIMDERNQKSRELLEKLVADNHIEVDFSRGFPNFGDIAEKTDYNKRVESINKEYDQKLTKELDKLETDFRAKQDHQAKIAANLSRVSPMCSYSFFLSELCNTGFIELSNNRETAKKFQFQVTSDVYSKYREIRYFYQGSSIFSSVPKEGVDVKNLPVPVMAVNKASQLNIIFSKTWPDIVLLIWFSIFFFMGAFVSFLRLDVR